MFAEFRETAACLSSISSGDGFKLIAVGLRSILIRDRDAPPMTGVGHANARVQPWLKSRYRVFAFARLLPNFVSGLFKRCAKRFKLIWLVVKNKAPNICSRRLVRRDGLAFKIGALNCAK